MLGPITIHPNPAVDGQPVTITLPRGGTWHVSVDGSGEVRTIRADENQQIEITLSAPNGGTFTVSDGANPPTDASFDIVSQRS